MESPNKSPSKENPPKDLERTVSTLFERNWKSWETILFNQIRAQSEMIEDRLSKKLSTGAVKYC